MAEPKTRRTGVSVAAFIAAVADPVKRDDSRALVSLMTRVTGAKAEMWGPSIIGCGRFLYKPGSSPAYEWPVAAFSPRKPALVVYLIGHKEDPKLLARLGKHKADGVSCLYMKRLADVDMSVLETLVERSVAKAREMEKSGGSMRNAYSKPKTSKAAKAVKPAKAVKAARPKRASATARPMPARKPTRAR